ncbi:ATP-binding protein [Streptosporangium saharense]|uniref:Anti-sigma regulatory factor (Ser/Thr protein kinase) n=1 Tax=Streptosporangium saharense TaxID=1706840 RepID=A0A7W7QNS1_9ACTN|nr:ATP-binding protein [Streptosporangium saharense]MBB4916972.1 anti-sigma regulatory factor (Ser/Thr protein kinase) [Streptosporangium saharense]
MTGDQGQQWPIDEDLSALRDHLLRRATLAGLRGDRLDDLLIAVNEAVINVLEHGGGEGTVTIRHDTAAITVDIVDSAGVLSQRDVPPRRPADAVRGFGLWLMSQLCDEFTIRRSDGRSRVRLRMSLDAVPAR